MVISSTLNVDSAGLANRLDMRVKGDRKSRRIFRVLYLKHLG